MVVTANCKNPEAAFTIGDLMSSEYIGISQRWGKEGVDWDYASNLKDTSKLTPSVAGFDLSILTYDDSNFWGGTATTKNCWRQVGPYVRQYGLANGWSTGAGGGDEYATMLFVIGPEGGIAPKEEDLLESFGYIPISLGNRIMRVETAAIYIASVVNFCNMG